MSGATAIQPAGLAVQLADWLSSQHTDTTDIEVANLRSTAQGYSNDTQLFDLHWRRQGRSEHRAVVLRLQATTNQAGTFPDNDISVQYRCMAALATTPVPVPRLLGHEVDPGPLGAPFYLMEQVAGQVPNENPLYHLEGWLHELPPAQRADLWLQGIDAIARIGRVDLADGRFSFLDRQDLATSPADQPLEYFRRHMLWAAQLHRPYPHLYRAWDWLTVYRPARRDIALCWGDAKLGNCVFRDGRLVAALDWEGAHLGPPEMDLAWWLTIDRCLSEGYGVPRLPGLPGREASVARWEAAAGRKAQDLDYYEVFSAFKLASIMARIGTVYQQRGLVPAEMQMDSRNGAATVLAMLGRQHGYEAST